MAPPRVDFHFARLHLGDKLDVALSRHKHYLFSKLKLKIGMRVLDVGCRSGIAALELVQYAGVKVVGIDNNPEKIDEANRMARSMGLSNELSFVLGDLDRLSDYFPSGSFDAIYSIESLRDLSNCESMYVSLHNLLKLGGRLAIYDWCWTELLDPLNPDHQRLAEIIECSTMIGRRQASQRSIRSANEALIHAHLHLVESVDRALITPGSNGIKWYAPLEAALGNSAVRWATAYGQPNCVFGGLTKEAAAVILYAGKHELFTPMAMLVGERP